MVEHAERKSAGELEKWTSSKKMPKQRCWMPYKHKQAETSERRYAGSQRLEKRIMRTAKGSESEGWQDHWQEGKYKNTTQDHGRTNSSDGHAKISGQSHGKILFEEEVIKLPKVWELTLSIQGLCWTSVTRHVNSLWSSYMLWWSSASGQVQQVVSAGGSRLGTDIMEDWKTQNPPVWNVTHRQKEQKDARTQWEQMVKLEPEEADAGPKNPGAATMLIHIQQTFEHVQLRVVWSWMSVLQILVFLLHTLCVIVAHQRIVVLEGSIAASVQPYTAKLPWNKFSVVMREPMKAVFKVWPEVRSTVHVDDKKFVCKHQSGRRDSNSTESV